MIGRYGVQGGPHGPAVVTDLDLREVASVTFYEKPLFRLRGGTGGYVAGAEDVRRFLADWEREVARRNLERSGGG